VSLIAQHAGPSRFFDLPGPVTFTLLFIFQAQSRQATVRAVVLGLPSFCQTSSNPAKKGRENSHSSCIFITNLLARVCHRAGFASREFQTQRRRGERMSFYTNRERTRGCIRAGFVKRDFQTQRRRGERMSFYTNRERTRGCIRAGFVKRVQTQRRRGENMCRKLVSLSKSRLRPC